MVNNDYMGCDFYQNQAKNANNEGFVTFFDETSAKFYFAYINTTTEKVIFRSEGYPTAAARKNGLNSVIKNLSFEKQYAIEKEGKDFFVILKAKNHIEIARTCPFSSKKEAELLIAELSSTSVKEVKAATVEVLDVKATVKTASKEAKTTVKTATKKVIAEPKAKSTPKKENNKTAFATAELYLGHPTMQNEFGNTGFALFTADDAKHYFVVYNQDGTIFQRSAGFDSVEQRDSIFSDAQIALMNENAYQIVEEGNNFSVQLLSDKGEVLTSSTTFGTYTDAFLRTPKGWSQPTEVVGTMY